MISQEFPRIKIQINGEGVQYLTETSPSRVEKEAADIDSRHQWAVHFIIPLRGMAGQHNIDQPIRGILQSRLQRSNIPIHQRPILFTSAFARLREPPRRRFQLHHGNSRKNDISLRHVVQRIHSLSRSD